MVMPSLPEESILDMFLGLCPGSIGEISALALLLGGGYLVYRKVISLRIPVAYLGSVALLTLVFSKAGDPASWMLYSLFSGGVMLGAIFMATDYATSPATPVGQVIYGVGCGALTVIFRYFGLFPEGVTYAILLMNALVWLIDRFTAPRRFGTKKGGAAA
jgi:electron transport complex protein RnfD